MRTHGAWPEGERSPSRAYWGHGRPLRRAAAVPVLRHGARGRVLQRGCARAAGLCQLRQVRTRASPTPQTLREAARAVAWRVVCGRAAGDHALRAEGLAGPAGGEAAGSDPHVASCCADRAQAPPSWPPCGAADTLRRRSAGGPRRWTVGALTSLPPLPRAARAGRPRRALHLGSPHSRDAGLRGQRHWRGAALPHAGGAGRAACAGGGSFLMSEAGHERSGSRGTQLRGAAASGGG
jgi:hypothetical protein